MSSVTLVMSPQARGLNTFCQACEQFWRAMEPLGIGMKLAEGCHWMQALEDHSWCWPSVFAPWFNVM